MNKLWIRLSVAFAFVSVIGIVTAAVLARQQVNTQFKRFVAHDMMLRSPLVAELATYHDQHGGWAGVDSILGNHHGPGPMRPDRSGWRGGPALTLADSSGQIVYARQGNRHAGQLTEQERAEAVAIETGGQVVGYLTFSAPSPAELEAPAQVFLDRFNRFVLEAGLIAMAIGAVVGLFVARGLAAPLGELAAAARQIAQGKLDRRVPTKGTDEVADLARAFNEMAGGLQQAEMLRRNMVADIAHELRTPLTVIQGNLKAILDDVYPLEKTEIATVYDETLILNRLIGDLRELAQAEAGQLSLSVRPTDVAPVVSSAVALFDETARQKGIELDVSVPPDLPQAQADPDRVRQVIQNLLANALQHTPAGGRVTIQASVTGDQSLHPDRSPLLTVSDTGPGIAAGDLPHVFDRFWRAERSRSRERGGSGLGLAIAKHLVEAQGGQIGVESQEGAGSSFWFTLPCAQPEA